ncbi:BLUF domain-containing protein [Sphingomonas morindae]|uniref:BLUF domain-containing protein n=1 Tax=Sphingomonas morindae TaxID=1541170 RepID=A0ABY4XDL2_9SPHN|nr:BLUF domain-containing protein [Sphingomonas morindae]USI75008.1 BLUF domain-containing protein [Sphingomonas morindae]
MRQIVYTSVRRTLLDDAALIALRRLAERRNARLGVTGLLVYDGQRFIQALEGEAEALATLMTAILHDARHEAVEIRVNRAIARAEFGDWSMNFRHACNSADAGRLVATVKADVARVSDSHLQAAFIGFAVLGSRR